MLVLLAGSAFAQSSSPPDLQPRLLDRPLTAAPPNQPEKPRLQEPPHGPAVPGGASRHDNAAARGGGGAVSLDFHQSLITDRYAR